MALTQYISNIIMADAKTKRITIEQKLLLVQYLEEHKDFAHDRFSSDAGAKSLAEQWAILAKRLNCLGGANKNGEGWKRAWVNMKSKTKQKSQDLKKIMEKSGINGQIQAAAKLTELDERIVGIISRVAVFGSEEVAEPLRDGGFVPNISLLNDDDDECTIPNTEPTVAMFAALTPLTTVPDSLRKRRHQENVLDMEFLDIERRKLEIAEESLAMQKKQYALDEKRLIVEEKLLAFAENMLEPKCL